MYLFIHTYIHTCIYTVIHISISMYIYIHTYIYICMSFTFYVASERCEHSSVVFEMVIASVTWTTIPVARAVEGQGSWRH